MGARITVERPNDQRLKALKISSWPIWTKEPSTFQWHYDDQETCYFFEGEEAMTLRAEVHKGCF